MAPTTSSIRKLRSNPSFQLRTWHACARFAFLLGTGMKKAKAPRVPVLENAFEVNLPKLMKAVKAAGSSRLVLDDGVVRTAAVLTETRLAVYLGGHPWVADIVHVHCLKGRVRPLLKCPRAHEGNFQSLYYCNGELACRHCHRLRYRSNVAATVTERARLAHNKLQRSMGGQPGQLPPKRYPYKWRSRYFHMVLRLAGLRNLQYEAVRSWLKRKHDNPSSKIFESKSVL